MFLTVIVTTALGVLGGTLLGYAGSCATGGCALMSSPWTGALWGGLVGLAMGLSMLGRPEEPSGAGEEAGGDEAKETGCGGSGRKRFRFL